jgi:hypothetical protein
MYFITSNEKSNFTFGFEFIFYFYFILYMFLIIKIFKYICGVDHSTNKEYPDLACTAFLSIVYDSIKFSIKINKLCK